MIAYLGAPVAYWDLHASKIAGPASIVLLLAVALVYWLTNRNRKAIAITPWLGLCLFALGCASLTAFGRVQYGVWQALSSRYQTFSALWWGALFVLTALSAKLVVAALHAPGRGRLVYAQVAVASASTLTLLVLCAGLIRAIDFGLREGNATQEGLWRSQQCMLDYSHAPESCLTRYFPDPAFVLDHARYLERERFGIFYGP